MSLSFLDLREMDSEMETAGIAGGSPGTETFAASLCFQGTGWSAAQLYPTLAWQLGLSRHQAGVSPCHCLIRRALLSCLRPVFKGGQGLSPINGSEPGPYCFQINITCHKCGWGTSKI